ncbi:aspartate/glutamate racemase family protein [Seohaeicola sp. SP36]|jgi:Asp/Glu/hydantoin racemase|uniref:aspartate/glutamate racemase family protein n=1 Tax=unclassified Seohaeicola TaxID=2641111 RepID=UPI00237BDF5B|nr:MULTISPECIES: aspartate/glutamate racemase family protein [unclassified Seohaeicola]MDD9708990.1 aspartate/glutamate racemase family protein [Seohaeicola sp. 4SK31]MDD9737076.1 aspartate/glutamate racemase family protein [Seohaeicola sp. SP36]MDF1709892.1 aspartate/glutamate racemase family protein [Paracoccaceae bacterium]
MTIYVINPNSSQHVTDGIDRAVDPMRAASPVAIEARTLAEGPPGIETQAHVDGVVAPLLAHCAKLEDSASAFVVACYSDPGLAALREQSARPVLGIAEASILTAMTMGQRFGIISILSRSIPRHMRYVGAMGVMDRLAADMPLELGVLDLADAGRTFDRLKTVGTRLRDEAMADVLILGCAGMTAFRTDLETYLGLPVVEPCQAATAMAIGRVALQKTRQDRA